ncbi:MAG: 23S rRNA (pseudouridine(1915)-N(3))-methyltransferase RlmH [Candidatus Saccharimonas sp.]
MIKIIAVGKKHESWVLPGLKRYLERLQGPWRVEWVFLPHSTKQGQEARLNESEAILKRLNDTDFVILLDERGVLLTSPTLSQQIESQLNHSRPVVLVIGGAYGVDDRVRQRAQVVWSLSPLVFPHQLVRLLCIEQLYRAQSIARGSAYHHE